MRVIAHGDKRRQVTSGWGIREEKRREEKRRGTMRVIVPGDKRRQVTSRVVMYNR